MNNLDVTNSINELTYQDLKKIAKIHGIKKYAKKKELVTLILSEVSQKDLRKHLAPNIFSRAGNFFKKIHLVGILVFLIPIAISLLLWLYPRPMSENDILKIAKATKEENKAFLNKEYPTGYGVIAIPPTPINNKVVIVPTTENIKGVFIDYEHMKIVNIDQNNIDINIPEITINTENQEGGILENIIIRLDKRSREKYVMGKFADVILSAQVLNTYNDVVYVAIGIEKNKPFK
jgi:hypothetical protein